MKVTSVEIHPSGSSEFVSLSFRDPRRQNPYNIKAIIGLDADEIVPRYYGASGSQKFYNLTLEKRDLVFRIELNPDFSTQSYSELRDDLYRLVSSSRTGLLEVQFKNNTEVVAIVSGFVSKIEAAHFTKQPEVQITVGCSDPMLRAPSPINVDVSGLDPALTVVSDTLSTAPHGFRFELEFLTELPAIDITNPDEPGLVFEVTPSGGFITGDVLHFSSELTEKYLYILRGANTIRLADVITPGSIWPILFPGDNSFVIGSPTAVQWDAISHRPTYWGV